MRTLVGSRFFLGFGLGLLLADRADTAGPQPTPLLCRAAMLFEALIFVLGVVLAAMVFVGLILALGAVGL
jgi:hypothetical protein